VARAPVERVTVALVRGLHGLRGAVRVEVLSDAPERFAPGTILYLEGDDRPLTVAWAGPASPGLLLRFAELSSREAVEPLRGRYLEVVPEAPLPEGTFYWHEIVGLDARTPDGEHLGTVREVFRAGAGEVYVVTGGPRGEILVPAVRAVVTELAPAEGYLVIDPASMPLPPVHQARQPDDAGGEPSADDQAAVGRPSADDDQEVSDRASADDDPPVS
jgi:16S rRNA processing protein RimM